MPRFLFAAVVCLCGCSFRPAGVDPVDVNPKQAAAKAIELYDADRDGLLSGEELNEVPGIVMAKGRYDADGDGAVSEEEIRKRLEDWETQGLGFRELAVSIAINGRPVNGAQVRLVPEAYLGDAVKPATGQTLPDGVANVSVDQEDLPAALKDRGVTLYGVTGGTYKIEIIGGDVPLPKSISPQTPLGVEVAHDTIQGAFYLNIRGK